MSTSQSCAVCSASVGNAATCGCGAVERPALTRAPRRPVETPTHEPHGDRRADAGHGRVGAQAPPAVGPRKLRAWLVRRHPAQELSSASAMASILKRHGLTAVQRRRQRRRAAASHDVGGSVGERRRRRRRQRRRRRRRRRPAAAGDGDGGSGGERRAPAEPFGRASAPSSVRCIDFKGKLKTGDGEWCTPFTITDACSRFCIRCELVEEPDARAVERILDSAFRELGLPAAIRSDNGPPFAAQGPTGLTSLAGVAAPAGHSPRADHARTAAGERAQRALPSNARGCGHLAGTSELGRSRRLICTRHRVVAIHAVCSRRPAAVRAHRSNSSLMPGRGGPCCLAASCSGTSTMQSRVLVCSPPRPPRPMCSNSSATDVRCVTRPARRDVAPSECVRPFAAQNANYRADPRSSICRPNIGPNV